MIIARYLNKQILLLTAAVTFVLLAVSVLIRLLNYLGDASEGQIDPGVLLLLMAYRLPEFVQLILPLALLLGILLAYGRMYADNEMTVLISSGMSKLRLLAYTLFSSVVVAILVAVLSFYLTPKGLLNTGALLEQQQNLNEFDIMVPGVFQDISNGARTTYAAQLQQGEILDVFMHEAEADRLTVADSAVLREAGGGDRLVAFSRGSVSEGMVSGESFLLTNFAELSVRMAPREINFEGTLQEQAMSTVELFNAPAASSQAELQWRFSLLLLIPVLTLLAVPLSRVNPRQGRFARLVPAVLFYIAYFGMLLASRDWVADGLLPPLVGLWWVHCFFLFCGILLFIDRLPGFSSVRV